MGFSNPTSKWIKMKITFCGIACHFVGTIGTRNTKPGQKRV